MSQTNTWKGCRFILVFFRYCVCFIERQQIRNVRGKLKSRSDPTVHFKRLEALFSPAVTLERQTHNIKAWITLLFFHSTYRISFLVCLFSILSVFQSIPAPYSSLSVFLSVTPQFFFFFFFTFCSRPFLQPSFLLKWISLIQRHQTLTSPL